MGRHGYISVKSAISTSQAVSEGKRQRVMKSRNKIWLGVGAFVMTGTALDASTQPAELPTLRGLAVPQGATADVAFRRVGAGGLVLAQHGDHGKEPGKDGG